VFRNSQVASFVDPTRALGNVAGTCEMKWIWRIWNEAGSLFQRQWNQQVVIFKQEDEEGHVTVTAEQMLRGLNKEEAVWMGCMDGLSGS